MSLIAQMLKDLDQRESQARQERPLSFEPGPMVAPPSFGGLTQVVMIVAGIAVAAAAGVFIWKQVQKPSAPSSLPVPVAQVPPPMQEVRQEAPMQSPEPVKFEEKPASAPIVVPAVPPVPPVAKVDPVPKSKPEPVVKAPELKQPEQKAEQLKPKAEPQPKPPKHETKMVKAVSSEPKPAEKQHPLAVKEEVAKVPAVKPVPEAQVAGFKVVNPRQNSENLYKQAIIQAQQGLATDSIALLRQSLESYSGNHAARKMLSGLLNETGRGGEAVSVLKEGLRLDPNQIGFAMTLARLQVAQGSKANALATMEESLAVAGNDPEYRAFVAALQQDMGRFNEAVQNYLVALRSDPSRSSWLVGIGISLVAVGKDKDAAEAFQRALDTGDLKPDVARYAQQQLLKLR